MCERAWQVFQAVPPHLLPNILHLYPYRYLTYSLPVRGKWQIWDWNHFPWPNAPSPLLWASGTLTPTYEPHLLFEWKPPHLALYYSFCFQCISPGCTIRFFILLGSKIKPGAPVSYQESNTGPHALPKVGSCATHAPILPSRERLVDPKFAKQHIRNIGHDIQTTLGLFFLNSWGEYRRGPWKKVFGL